MKDNNNFWNFVEETLGSDPDAGLEDWARWQFSPTAIAACELLVAQVAGSGQWRSWRTWGEKQPQLFILPLIISLKIGSRGHERAPSCCPARFDPKNIRMHLAEDEFAAMLARPLPLPGDLALTWNVIGGRGSFHQSTRGSTCLADTLHMRHYDPGKQDYMVESVDGGALVLVSGAIVDVYPFPRNWAMWTAQIVHARETKEYALKTLPELIGNLVSIVGYESVLSALTSHRQN